MNRLFKYAMFFTAFIPLWITILFLGRITEQLAIMEARVYLDRSDAEPISSYISQHSAEEGTDYVQAAQDEDVYKRQCEIRLFRQ